MSQSQTAGAIGAADKTSTRKPVKSRSQVLKGKTRAITSPIEAEDEHALNSSGAFNQRETYHNDDSTDRDDIAEDGDGLDEDDNDDTAWQDIGEASLRMEPLQSNAKTG